MSTSLPDASLMVCAAWAALRLKLDPHLAAVASGLARLELQRVLDDMEIAIALTNQSLAAPEILLWGKSRSAERAVDGVFPERPACVCTALDAQNNLPLNGDGRQTGETGASRCLRGCCPSLVPFACCLVSPAGSQPAQPRSPAGPASPSSNRTQYTKSASISVDLSKIRSAPKFRHFRRMSGVA